MFTGIVQDKCPVVKLERLEGLTRFGVQLTPSLLQGLQIGASVAIDGACLTVVEIEPTCVWFEAIPETLKKTTLKGLFLGKRVNVERSARFGDEIGGHLLSGHVFGTACIKKIQVFPHHRVLTIEVPDMEWMKWLLPKGFIAIDGISLTVVEVNREAQAFTVHLIPETFRITTLSEKKEGDPVNIEIDSQTQAIVSTVERVLAQR